MIQIIIHSLPSCIKSVQEPTVAYIIHFPTKRLIYRQPLPAMGFAQVLYAFTDFWNDVDRQVMEHRSIAMMISFLYLNLDACLQCAHRLKLFGYSEHTIK